MSKELTTTVTDEQQESQAVVMRLINTGKAIDITLPESLLEQQQWTLERYDAHINSGLQLGYGLVVIKAQMEHGEFGEWLKSNNIKDRTAQEYMKVAKFLSVMQDKSTESNSKNAVSALLENQPKNPNLDPDIEAEQEVDAVLAKIIKLPLYKQLVLTSQPAERIREWWQSDLFKEIDKMPPTEIRALIRQQKEIEALRGKAKENLDLLKEKHDEVERYKHLPKNSARVIQMQNALIEDLQAMQGVMDRARKTFEEIKHYSQEIETDVLGAVVHPLLHMLNYSKGETLSLSNALISRFNIDPQIPVNAPDPEQMSEHQLWMAKTATVNQLELTKKYLK